MIEKTSGAKSPITLRHLFLSAAVLLLFALVFAAPAAAEGTPVEITPDYGWYSADAEIYEINSIQDLAGFAKLTQGAVTGVTDAATNFEGKTVKLISNLNFGDYQYWYYNDGTTLIDYRIKNFAGTFDGNYYTISNMWYSQTVSVSNNQLAFFDKIVAGGSVKNLVIDTVTADFTYSTTFSTFVSILAGEAFNCHAKDVTVTSSSQVTVHGFGKIDGANASADMCSVDGLTITTTYEDSVAMQGGGFGSAANGASITNCDVKNVLATCYGEMKYSGFGSIDGECKSSTVENIKMVIKGPEGWTKDCAGFGGATTAGTIEDCHVRNIQYISESPSSLRMVGGFTTTTNGNFKDCTVTDILFDVVGSTTEVGGFACIINPGTQMTNCRVNNIVMNLGTGGSGGADAVGGFAGKTQGGSYQSSPAVITNCHVIGLEMNVGKAQNWSHPLAGFISVLGSAAQISDCTVTGSIYAPNFYYDGTYGSSYYAMGGFIGDLGWGTNDYSTVTDCIANVDITTNAPAGGFIAQAYRLFHNAADTYIIVKDCVANGDVTSTENYAGGFVAVGSRGVFENCVANGNVVGATDAGGFWGKIIPSKTVGTTNPEAAKAITITNCHANGQVSATSGFASGFVGTINTLDAENNYQTTVTITGSTASEVVAGSDVVAFAKDITVVPEGSTSLYTETDNTVGATSPYFVQRPVYDLGTAELSKEGDVLRISGALDRLNGVNEFTVTIYDKFGEEITSLDQSAPSSYQDWTITISEGSKETNIEKAPTYALFTIDGLEYKPAIAVACTNLNDYGFPMIWADYFQAGVNEAYYFFTHQKALDEADKYTNPVVTFLSKYADTVTINKAMTLDLGRFDAKGIEVNTNAGVIIKGIDRKDVVLTLSDEFLSSNTAPAVTKDSTAPINVPAGYQWIANIDGTDTLVKIWTISFNTDVTEIDNPESVETNAYNKLDTLPVLERVGYTYVWADESGTAVEETTEFHKDTTLTAQWTPIEYTITFMDGETFIDTITLPYGTEITTVPEPVKDGFLFAGWVDSENNGYSVPETMPAESVTVKAKWNEVPAGAKNITFNSNGGTGVLTITEISGTTVAEPEPAPTKEGHTFAGWYVNEDLTGEAYAFTVMPDDDLLLHAKWNVNQYTITFNIDGDTTTVPSVTQDYDTAIVKPENPTKTGYTFAGWEPAIPAKMPADDLEVVAQWTIDQYTITFVDTDGTILDTITRDYGADVTAPANPEKIGNTFAGWVDQTGTPYTFPIEMPINGLTIYAAWTPIDYTITFKTDGGTEIAPITGNYGDPVTAPANPTKTGYTFTGWDKKIPETMPAGNVVITALWTEELFTLTFNTDGGSVIAPIRCHANDAVTKPADPTRTGYTFAGWNPAIPETMPDGDLEVFAQWTVNQYTIKFNTTGGSTIPSITQDYGTAIEKPADPTKEGYIFAGWEPEIPETMPVDGIEVFAQWTEDAGDSGNEEKPVDPETPDTTEPEVPKTPGTIAPEVPAVNANGNTATITPASSEQVIETSADGKTTTIDAGNGVTITLTSTDPVTPVGGSVAGTFNTVEAAYKDIPATLKGGSDPVTYGLLIPMDAAKALADGIPLPTIDATFNDAVAGKVAGHNGNSYNSLAMIQATHTGGIGLVNGNIAGEITVTFILPASVGQKLVVFHVPDNGTPTLLAKDKVEISDPVNGQITVTAKGTGFSGYVVAQDTTPTNSGSSTPQGSSVWLTETQAPTETPTPSEQPTDVAPTDVPTTQPTETPKTPGFGVLAVLAGLGAVAVLRRK